MGLKTGTDKGDVNISLKHGKAQFTPARPGTKYLDKEDWFDVKLPSELSIMAIKFFHSDHDDPNNMVGSWSPAQNKDIGAYFHVSGTAHDARIKDIDSPTGPDTFYYKVWVNGPNAPAGGWALDPMLVNKKKS